MRKAIGLLALLLCLCLGAGAAAEPVLLPQVEQWDASLPVEITLSADVKSHMPYDDDRCAQLNALLKHVTLSLATSTAEDVAYSRVAVGVDGREAMWLMQRETADKTQLQLSWQPDMTISGGSQALNELLGQSTEEISLYGLDGSEMAWLDDGAAMMSSIGASLEAYGKETAIKTSIKNMGTARRKIIYTVPKDETAQLVQAIAAHCPEGELKDFLSGLIFSGRQKVILWLTSEGEVLRAEYAGICGTAEDDLRQVSLKWRMRRTDDLSRDDLTLKTPAVKGNNYNTLTIIRDLEESEDGSVSCEIEFSESVSKDAKKSSRSGEVELLSVPEGDGNKLTGTVTVSQQLPDEDSKYSTVIQPELLLASSDGTPEVSGTVTVQELRGKNVLEEAVVSMTAGAGTDIQWLATAETVQLEQLTEEQRAAITAGMSTALVPHLALLPQEDTLFLSADLPEDVWQRIVEAARSALPEEVAQ